MESLPGTPTTVATAGFGEAPIEQQPPPRQIEFNAFLKDRAVKISDHYGGPGQYLRKQMQDEASNLHDLERQLAKETVFLQVLGELRIILRSRIARKALAHFNPAVDDLADMTWIHANKDDLYAYVLDASGRVQTRSKDNDYSRFVLSLRCEVDGTLHRRGLPPLPRVGDEIVDHAASSSRSWGRGTAKWVRRRAMSKAKAAHQHRNGQSEEHLEISMEINASASSKEKVEEDDDKEHARNMKLPVQTD